MKRNMGSGANSAGCRDEQTIGRMLDGELQMDAAELLMHHLKFCEGCSQTFRRLQEEKLFCSRQLGQEDESGEGETSLVLPRVWNRVQEALRSPERHRAKGIRWGRRWMSLAACAALLFSMTVPFLTIRINASADEILSETLLREKMWATRPDVVLRWVVTSTLSNGGVLPAGRYRAERWQNNHAGQIGSIIRRYDEQGHLVWARWERPDGSEVTYNHFRDDLLSIRPSMAELEQAIPFLKPDLQEAVRREITRIHRSQVPQLLGQDYVDWFRNSMRPGNREASMKLVQTAEWGPVFHIRVDRRIRIRGSRLLRVLQESYISATDFNRYRLKSEHYLSDGSVYFEDSVGSEFRESTIEDFDNNTLTDLLKSSPNVVRLSAQDFAKTLLRTGSNSRAPKNEK